MVIPLLPVQVQLEPDDPTGGAPVNSPARGEGVEDLQPAPRHRLHVVDPLPGTTSPALVGDLDPQAGGGQLVADTEMTARAPGRRVEDRVAGQLADEQLGGVGERMLRSEGGNDESPGLPYTVGTTREVLGPAPVAHIHPRLT
jgi:hypothetical protein